jgi:hypothetical protein
MWKNQQSTIRVRGKRRHRTVDHIPFSQVDDNHRAAEGWGDCFGRT